MPAMRIAPNRYRIAKSQWTKWSRVGAHVVFNDLYGVMIDSQLLFRHPDTKPIDRARSTRKVA